MVRCATLCRSVPRTLVLLPLFALLVYGWMPLAPAGESPVLAGADQGAGGEDLQAGWRALMETGDLAEAFRRFQAASTVEGASPVALVSTGMAQIERGRYTEASEWMLKALSSPGWGPWQEMAAADLTDLIDDLADPAIASKALAQRLTAPDLAHVQRSLLRHLLATVEQRRGRLKESRLLLLDEPYVRSFQVIGPFANRDGGSFEEAHEIETLPLKDVITRSFPGRGRDVEWQPVAAAPDGKVNLSAILFPGSEVFAYALAFVRVKEGGEATLRVGASGACAVWVNGTPVARNNDYYRYHAMQRRIGVRLKRGVNAILLKVGGNRESGSEFSLALTPGAPDALEQRGSAATADAAVEGVDVISAGTRAGAARTKDDPFLQAASHFSSLQPGREVDPEALVDAGAAWGAAGFFESILKQEPENGLALLGRAYLRATRGMDDRKWTRVRSRLDKAVEVSPRSTMVLGLAAMTRPDENEARALLEQAVEVHPEALAVRQLLMDQVHRGGFHRDAEARARELLESGPSAYAWRMIGAVHQKRRWFAEARAAYARAVESAPCWPKPVLERFRSLKSDAEKEALLRSALASANTPEIRMTLAGHLQRMRKFREAADLYRQNLTHDPFDQSAWLGLADARRAQGDTKAEESALVSALDRLPQSPELTERLGRLLLEAGDKEEGLAWLHRSLAVKSDNPELSEYVKALEPQRELWFAAVDIQYDDLKGTDATAEQYPRHNAVVLLDQGYVQVNPNGTTRKMTHWVQKVLRPNGVQRAAQEGIPYDPERQRVEVIRARVIQPDGSVLENADVRERRYRGGVGGGVYSQYSQKIVTLPQVREGSIVELQYTVEATDENIYADEFEEGFMIGSEMPTLRFEFTADVPADMEVMHGQALTDLRPEVIEVDGRKRVRWRAQDLPGLEMEPSMPPMGDLIPSLRISSFTSWNEVGEWYWNLSKQQMELPDDIRAEVVKIVEAHETREGRIAAVYDWVTENIRYVSISFGLFGCKPHEAERTWRTRYGDCKDTAVLFCAMLREAGIEAQVALVRTYDLGREPTGVPGARLFNHAIAYVPAEEEGGTHYWLDGTTDYNIFGEVPLMDRGAMALLTGPDGGKAVTIDVATADMAVVRQDISVQLKPGGGGTIRRSEKLFGELAPSLRRAAETPERIRTALTMMAARQFAGGQLAEFSLQEVKPEAPVPTAGMELVMGIAAKRLAQPAGENLRLKPITRPSRLSARYATQRERTHDLMLGLPMTQSVTVKIDLPAGATVVSLPERIVETHSFASYSRTCTDVEGGVRIESELKIHARRLSAEDYDAFRRFCNRVDSAEEEWVVYKEDPDARPAPEAAAEEAVLPAIVDHADEETVE